MDKLKIAFVGMGSIATRHFGNVCTYLDSVGIKYEIDIYRSGLGKPLADMIEKKAPRQIALTEDLKIEEQYDVIFITNPTSLHFETLERFQNNGKAFFIEKPVFSTNDVDVKRLSGLAGKVCYVACPLRYNPAIDYIKNNIDCTKVISARAISSSYLPDWRPGTDYRKCYSAHEDMGGGVDIDLIHEWDYLTYLFGEVEKGYAIAGRLSDLEIDSNDIAIYIAKTEKTAVELHLDYFGRESIRKVQLFMPEDTIECDILNGEIRYLKSGEVITFNKERNSFQMQEIKHFFDIVFGKIENDSTINHALQVLRYAKGDFR